MFIPFAESTEYLESSEGPISSAAADSIVILFSVKKDSQSTIVLQTMTRYSFQKMTPTKSEAYVCRMCFLSSWTKCKWILFHSFCVCCYSSAKKLSSFATFKTIKRIKSFQVGESVYEWPKKVKWKACTSG